MSSGTSKIGPPSKPGQPGLTGQAILLDKLNRRSTPDSEALASSDDEGDQHRQDQPAQPVTQPPKPVRRASWLNDTTQPLTKPRKGSFASNSMSPTASHPTTPSAEGGVGGPWGPHAQSSAAGVMGRGPAAQGTFPWTTAIWNSERKDPPSRLSEVLPSPTSTIPPGATGASFFGPETNFGQTSPAPRENNQNSQIPFAIPLHPTPKTYRSQSYSVGQMDPDSSVPSTNHPTVLGRNRGHPHSGLQHRPSRPSMLSEMSSDGGVLGKVKEVEDDDEEESPSSSMHSSLHQTAEAKKIEILTRENAMLRQQQQRHYQESRLRPRTSTGGMYSLGNGYSMHEAVPEESDYAIDELDEAHDNVDMANRRALSRRMSEYGAGVSRGPYENRKLEGVKKNFWHSSLGFGAGPDGQQSRRHSFADVPTRQASISSINESLSHLETPTGETQLPPDVGSGFGVHSDAPHYPGAVNPDIASFLTAGGALAAPPQGSSFNNPFPSPYGMQQASFANRAPSPHRNLYAMSQPRHNQLLHIVLFKCARADVFYIQEGTGLTVKPGDLVIVEADRGTDLGTVMRENVDWQTAKELKEHYAEEQYKWLMMYSQNAAQEGAGAGLMAASNGLQGSAVGGMGPASHQHMQEPNAGELKPKLIKRLAQTHEIISLREKEGNEAKAKRVCMQKVKEHGLNMEILDAEFQMDWKKLTFYYFADSYINFNSLVTDLFKIYKTRIWMSAINPASFASPTLGIQAPSGIGPGAVGIQRGGHNSDRRQNQQYSQPQSQPQPQAQPQPQPQMVAQEQQHGFPAPNASRAGPSGYFMGRDNGAMPGMGFSQQPYPYPAMGGHHRPENMPYSPGMLPGAGYALSQTMDYHGRGRLQPSPSGSGALESGGPNMNPPPGDWVNNFQGLSLNSR